MGLSVLDANSFAKLPNQNRQVILTYLHHHLGWPDATDQIHSIVVHSDGQLSIKWFMGNEPADFRYLVHGTYTTRFRPPVAFPTWALHYEAEHSAGDGVIR